MSGKRYTSTAVISVLAAAAMLLLGAAANAQPSGSPGSAPSTSAEGLPEPIKLERQDVEIFIAVIKDFQAAGLDKKIQEQAEKNPGSYAEQWERVQADGEARKILKNHDITDVEDMRRFDRVAFSVHAARFADEFAALKAQLEQSLQQLEARKSQFPDAQYDNMMQMIEAQRQLYEEQPEGNVELVAEYEEELSAIPQIQAETMAPGDSP